MAKAEMIVLSVSCDPKAQMAVAQSHLGAAAWRMC